MATEKSWIVYGPQGCGKTLHAKAIAKALGLDHIVDDWDGSRSTLKLTNTLHITHHLPRWVEESGVRRVLTFDEAMRRVNRHG